MTMSVFMKLEPRVRSILTLVPSLCCLREAERPKMQGLFSKGSTLLYKTIDTTYVVSMVKYGDVNK